MTGTCFNIQRFCLHDGPGIRTTVFLKGCPLRCIWCHNPESQSRKSQLMLYADRCTQCGMCLCCTARALSPLQVDRDLCTACGKCAEVCPNRVNEIAGKLYTPEEVMAEVIRDKAYYETSGGGLTISGGEPAFQPEFTLELLTLARKNQISSALETCGWGNSDFFKEALRLGALFLYDIKCADSEKHKQLTGVDNDKIISNLDMLLAEGAKIILRLPMIPGVNDTDADISAAAQLIKNRPQLLYVELMPYHSLGISKEKALGRVPVIDIPDARSLADNWQRKFLENGVDVRISE